MAPSSSGDVGAHLGDSVTPKPERMLDGFPWVSAIILYTLSWGWSLLRPNTLYWDDWTVIFEKPKFFMLTFSRSIGKPPWSDLFEALVIPYGLWTVQLSTFVLFFVCGLIAFQILKSFRSLSLSQLRMIVLLFLIVPVNHARISRNVFDYTSSYFLFYLGWFLLVRYKSAKSFLLACVILFSSFKTHSFLVFILLPFLHFAWLNKSQLIDPKKLSAMHLRVAVIVVLPVLYVILRSIFWPAIDTTYQHPTISGTQRALVIFLPLVVVSIWYLTQVRRNRKNQNMIILICGLGSIALALFPYFSAGVIPDYISLIAFRSDWGSRHQMLIPLGISLTVVAINELMNWKSKNIIFSVMVVISLVLNIVFASTYFLDSVKKEEFVNLLTTRSDINEGSEIVIVDETKRFNGRGATYRDPELIGLFSLAGHKTKSLTQKQNCDELPNSTQMTLKSDTPYLKALVTRDLGLYFEVTPCSEVLAKDS